MNIDEKINQINARLKTAQSGVKLQRIGQRMYLQATLPPRPLSNKTKPHQQRIALKIYANLDGVKQAEIAAKKLAYALAFKEFSWNDYINQELPLIEEIEILTIKKLIAGFEDYYFTKRRKDHKSLTTWKGDYLKILLRLPMDEILTEELLMQVIRTTTADTKTRKRACMVLASFASFARFESCVIENIKSLAGRYSPFHTSARDIPSDELIASWFLKIPNLGYRWVYGMMAAYGLRNHEVFRLDFNKIKHGSYIVDVLEGKTGSRQIWPCYPEWVEEFNLFTVVLPPIALNKDNTYLGAQCGKYFRSIGLPFRLYDLRHAWAIRTLEFGLDVTLASQQMGHSVAVHSQLYHRWISEKHHQRAFELMMMRENRPKSPKIN